MPPQSTPFTEARTVEKPILKWLRTPELGGSGRPAPQSQLEKCPRGQGNLSLYFWNCAPEMQGHSSTHD